MKRLKGIWKAGSKQPKVISGESVAGPSQAPAEDAASSAALSTPGTGLSAPALVSSDTSATFSDGLKVWYDPQDATIDICFVHGLTGDRDRTWTAEGQSVPWPQALLPSRLPRARLLTWGYDAYVVRKSTASANRLVNHATNLVRDLSDARGSDDMSARPIIFVAHSLGGLVCKRAIVYSRNAEPHFQGVFDCVIGVMFLGTPHKGAWMATWAKIPATALKFVKSTNKSLLAILETNDQLLEVVQTDFLTMAREKKLNLICFFEELPFPGIGQIVPKASAALEGYPLASIRANHRNMVRFSSADDAGFIRLLGELMRWEGLVGPSSVPQPANEASLTLRQVAPVGSVAVPRSSRHYCIPLSKNRRFVGRDRTLGSLKQMFFQRGCQKVAITGLGGAGKTQVALKFAYWVKENQPDYSVFWVPALSDASFEQAYTEMAKSASILNDSDNGDPKEAVRRYLSSTTAGPWLLIVDNTDDIDLLCGPDGLSQYLPQNERGLTLFTTRSREVAVAVAHDIIGLGEMEEDEAMLFLEKSLHRKDYSRSTATELLRELNCIPLAISQAIAYLNRNQISIAKYLSLLRGTEQDMIDLMSREFHDSNRYAGSQNAIAITWLVSFEQIQKFDGNAARLLSFISQIEPKSIPRSILPGLESEEQMVHAIGTLCAYTFLVQRGDEDIFDMHSLVHLATRIWIQKQGLASQITKDAIQHLVEIFPFGGFASRALWRSYMPHALRVLAEHRINEMHEMHGLSLKVGTCLREDGRIKESVKWVEEAYRWRKDHLPQDHPNRLASQYALAIAYRMDGRIKEAIELLEHAVTIQEVLAEDHPDRLASQHALAVAYRLDGRIKEAIELLEHVVTIRQEVLAEDHPDRLGSQHALAIAYRIDGRIKEGTKLLEHAVTIQEVLAEDHPDRLGSQYTLAIAYQFDGRIKEAIELLEYVVTIQEVLAEDHPDRLGSQHALAIAYQLNGRTKQAIELLEHVVTIQEVLAEDHPDRLGSQHALAIAYRIDGRIKEAIELLEHIVTIQQEVLAEDHPNRLASQYALAVVYRMDGRTKQAIELLEHVVTLQEVLAEDHPDRLGSQHALAIAYRMDGRTKQAIELLEHVVTIRQGGIS